MNKLFSRTVATGLALSTAACGGANLRGEPVTPNTPGANCYGSHLQATISETMDALLGITPGEQTEEDLNNHTRAQSEFGRGVMLVVCEGSDGTKISTYRLEQDREPEETNAYTTSRIGQSAVIIGGLQSVGIDPNNIEWVTLPE